MKICGLVTEYNPFHNGHIHHMQEARRLTGCDYLIVAMSGNYVQRGTPAVIDKYERTRMALDGGADLVLEIPVLFSTASAETFAMASVSLLNQLGCVDTILFGTEAGDLTVLQQLAEVLNDEPRAYKEYLQDALRTGMSFPAARAQALDFYLGDQIDNLSDFLESPNNILGIEYLRALHRLGSPMKPMTIHRWKTRHNALDAEFADVASATALREMLYDSEDGVEKIVPFVTPYTAREFAMKYGVCTPVRADDFSLILQYKLMNETDRLTEYLDFAPELADRVRNLLPDCYSFKEWSAALKTKAFTHTRINRALIHTILGIKATDLEEYTDEDFCMYARILGFRQQATPLFSEIRANTNLPIISKMADAKNILSPKALKLLMTDVRTSDIFRAVVYKKFGTLLKDDYTAGIVKF